METWGDPPDLDLVDSLVPSAMTSLPTPAADAQSRRWLPAVVLLIVIGGGGWWGYRHWRAASTTAIQAAAAETVPVQIEDLTLEVSASGTVQPERVVNISPKQSGVVDQILVEEGERVEPEQLLAIMDDSDLQGRLLQAQGELTAAQANLQRLLAGSRPQEITQTQARLDNTQAALRQAEDQLSRNRELWQEGGISAQQLTLAEADRDRALASVLEAEQALALAQEGPRAEEIAQARAQVQAAEGAVQTIQTTLADTQIRAPFAGVIVQRFAEAGAFVTPTSVQVGSGDTPRVSSALVAIAGTNQVEVNVAESDIRRLQPGQSAEIRADAYPDLTFGGEVKRIAPQAVVQQNVISFQVELSVQDPDQLLRSGMSVDVEFEVEQLQQALTVPTVSILRQGDAVGVFIAGSEGQPEFVPLRVGETAGRKTQVISGLQGDERVYITFPEGTEGNTDSLLSF